MSKQSLEFHIKSDDYFGTLATVLSLMNQDIFEDNKDKQAQILEEKIKELVYLQKNYKIIKKDGFRTSNKEHREIYN